MGNNNDNLSKLRVYFGFQELIQRLKKSKVFMEYFNKGLVFLPNQIFSSDIQMKQALDKAKLIFLAEGKFYDKTIMDDEEDYDPIRRLNLIIQIIEYSSGRIITTPCCK